MLGGKLFVRVRLDSIREGPTPRQSVDPAGIGELARSISECGLLSPLIVRRGKDGYYLVAGRRRLLALRLLGRASAEAMVLDADGPQSAVCALVENVQRENLTCFEEAEAYRAILRATGMTQEALARKVGKSPSAVANKLRLLRLSAPARAVILKEGLGERSARALLKLPPELQKKAAETAARSGLNARQVEALADRLTAEPEKKARPRLICRDSRLFLNALLRTVRQIETAGFGIKSRVDETREGITVTVTLPRAQTFAPPAKKTDCQSVQNVIHLT